MSNPECAQFSFGDPLIAITALLELRDFLAALQSPSGCDKALLTTFRKEAGDEANKEAQRPAVESVFAEHVDSGSGQQTKGTSPRTGGTSDQRGGRSRRSTTQRRSG